MGSKVSKVEVPSEVLREHTGSINCMSISPDNSLLVTGSEDSNIRMWSVVTNNTECIGTLKGHTQYITCLGICDTFIISGSADNTLRKWCMTTCECLFTFSGHTARVNRIICAGNFFFSSSYDKTVRAWNFEADEEYDKREVIEGEENNYDGCVRIFKGHTRGVYSLVFIPAAAVPFEKNQLKISPSDVLLSGSADYSAKSWSFDTGKNIKTFTGHRGPINCMATDPSGRNLYTGSQDTTIRAWHISRGECLRVMEGHEGSVLCLLIVNRMMYTSSTDGKARCWATEFGDCTRIYKGHNHSVSVIKFHKGILFTGSGDSNVRAFDAITGNLLAEFQGHEAAVTSLAVVQDKLYSGSLDRNLIVWNIRQMLNLTEKNLNESEHRRRIQLETEQRRRLNQLEEDLDDRYPEDINEH